VTQQIRIFVFDPHDRRARANRQLGKRDVIQFFDRAI
jgi:hypothetical protein